MQRQTIIATKTFEWLLIAALAAVGVCFLSEIGVDILGLNWFIDRWFQEIMMYCAALLAAYRAIKFHQERLIWALVSVAIAMWATGNALFVADVGVSSVGPSLSDGFWVLFYLLMATAMILLTRSRLPLRKARPWVEGVIAALAASSLSSAIVLNLLQAPSKDDTLASFFNLLYPSLDMFLIGLIMTCALMYRKKNDQSLILLLFGFLMFAVADAVFFYQVSFNTYHVGSLVDIGWLVGLMSIGLAAVSPYYLPDGSEYRSGWKIRLWVPILCALISLFVLSLGVFEVQLHPITSMFAVLTLLIVLARTVVLFKDRETYTIEVSNIRHQLNEAQELSHMGSWETNLDTGYVYWSAGHYVLLGYPLNHHLQGKDFTERVADEDQETLQAWMQAMRDNPGTVSEIEVRYRPLNSAEERIMLLRGRVQARQGELWLQGTSQDVTVTHQQERIIRDNEEKYRLLTENSSDIIARYDTNAVCLYVSPAVERVTGWTIAEVVGQPHTHWLHPDEREELMHIDFREPAPDGFAIQHRFRRRDGSYIWLEAIVKQILDDDGNVIELQASIRDIHSRKAIETIKDELISVVSHELRTPLTSIRGSLNLVNNGIVGTTDEEALALLLVAERNSDRLMELINNMLDIERMESGKIVFMPQTYSTQEIAMESIKAVEGMARQQQVEVRWQSPDSEGWGDPDRLQQLLINLLSNAIKFSLDGGKVIVACDVDEQGSSWTVTDNGRGIPTEAVATIFDRFQQVDASDTRDKGGSGLGLHICQRIASEHGGTISVVSEPGVQTVFTVRLPLAPVADETVDGDNTAPDNHTSPTEQAPAAIDTPAVDDNRHS